MCENVDVGSSVIGNRHRKNKFVQIRLGEVLDTIVVLKNTVLKFDLDKPTDDIASNMLSSLTLVGEFLQAWQLLPKVKPKGYVYDIEEAIWLDGIKHILMPSQRPLEDLKCISTHDLSLTQLQNDFKENPLKCFTSPTFLLHDGLLCTMHSIDPNPLQIYVKVRVRDLGLGGLQRWSLQLDLPDLQQQCHHHASWI